MIFLLLCLITHYCDSPSGPLIFLAKIKASHAGEIQHDGKKSVSSHSEIRFQIRYDDVLHVRTTLCLFPNFIFTQPSKNHEVGGECVISLFLETHVYFQ